ncbi:MAG TPA: CvpA family protein [Candidatus Coprenecus stercoravium]|uniref:CvpA family protein n=1 Tax=Candidatus Coprenecus stercoravium TaxID=2840735 RepID=A0A9D2KBP4_9BACT|nr:CvpA family protein [Candidatus Coprenecus stercoravium]
MTVIDIIILILLALAIFKGLKDGLVRQVGGIAGLFLGIFLAGRFSALVASWLNQWINVPENIVKIISFVLIIIAVCICMSLLGRLLEKIIKITTLGWVNRILGMLLSITTTVLLIGVLLSLIDYVNSTWFTLIPSDQLNASKSVQIITSISDAAFPYIKQLFSL